MVSSKRCLSFILKEKCVATVSANCEGSEMEAALATRFFEMFLFSLAYSSKL